MAPRRPQETKRAPSASAARSRSPGEYADRTSLIPDPSRPVSRAEFFVEEALEASGFPTDVLTSSEMALTLFGARSKTWALVTDVSLKGAFDGCQSRARRIKMEGPAPSHRLRGRLRRREPGSARRTQTSVLLVEPFAPARLSFRRFATPATAARPLRNRRTDSDPGTSRWRPPAAEPALPQPAAPFYRSSSFFSFGRRALRLKPNHTLRSPASAAGLQTFKTFFS